MDKKLYIQSYCKIKNNEVILDGKIIFKEDSRLLKDFLKSAFKNSEISYSKFFKMDNLCKLAFLATEYILKDFEHKNTNIAVVFSNNASSLDTDRSYQDSINDIDNYYPSPAVFVYTLPNISIGEISIRHQLKSENAFFVFDNYNADFHHCYENSLIQTEKSDGVLGGWVNVDSENYEAFVYLVSEYGIMEHTEKNLIILYKN